MAAELIYFLVFPPLLSLYFCRCCAVKFSPLFALVCTAGYWGISRLGLNLSLPGSLPLLLCILLMTACGLLFAKQSLSLSVSVSALVFSLFFLTVSLVQSAGFWLAVRFSGLWQFVKCWDSLLALAELFLLMGTFAFFFRRFDEIFSGLGPSSLLLLPFPLVFTAFSESVVFSRVYGDTIVWNTAKGIVFPVVDSREIMLLHLLGYGGTFAVLTAFRSLSRSVRKSRDAGHLEFQVEQQKIYLLEAQARYDQTRAFRHDIQNHLLLLRELLSKGEAERAEEYLSALGNFAGGLSFPVRSGSPAVDLLLENKLSAARQFDISVDCELEIPGGCGISDMDWCVMLANGMDNAIAACRQLAGESDKRYIHISCRRRSGFFLLHMENGCFLESLPDEGIGLTNIRTAAEKYGGIVETSLKKGTYSLDILLPISQQQSAPSTSTFLESSAEKRYTESQK
ncbi:MAG: GHKL domain-containing protein [Oscillospiraceae bacterium]|jgi:hypothetical protein|nr:GHKL domain-containing protein [Oscillospiraceae bacterium]